MKVREAFSATIHTMELGDVVEVEVYGQKLRITVVEIAEGLRDIEVSGNGSHGLLLHPKASNVVRIR